MGDAGPPRPLRPLQTSEFLPRASGSRRLARDVKGLNFAPVGVGWDESREPRARSRTGVIRSWSSVVTASPTMSFPSYAQPLGAVRVPVGWLLEHGSWA